MAATGSMTCCPRRSRAAMPWIPPPWAPGHQPRHPAIGDRAATRLPVGSAVRDPPTSASTRRACALAMTTDHSSIFSRGYEYSRIQRRACLGARYPSHWGDFAVDGRARPGRDHAWPVGVVQQHTSELGGIVNMVRKRPLDTFSETLTGGTAAGTSATWKRTWAGRSMPGQCVGASTSPWPIATASSTLRRTATKLHGTLDVDLSDAHRLSVAWWRQDREWCPAMACRPGRTARCSTCRARPSGCDWNRFEGSMDDAFLELTHRFANGQPDSGARFLARCRSRHAYSASGQTPTATSAWPPSVVPSRRIRWRWMPAIASRSRSRKSSARFVVGSDFKRYDTDYRAWALRNLGTSSTSSTVPSAIVRPDQDYTTANQVEREAEFSKLTLRPVASLALIGGARLKLVRRRQQKPPPWRPARPAATSSRWMPGDAYAGAVWDIDDAHSLPAIRRSSSRSRHSMSKATCSNRARAAVRSRHQGSYPRPRSVECSKLPLQTPPTEPRHGIR
ncbi:hypothetical protein DSL92_06975 [Billgrantia gudaonensis]|uniref:TonB-dependent receptor n=1 Tax=Billgrantia gudaonensis TaxID=376427 RepID=A0A432JGZ6_9GAMM|nr:hypothetical protein DSL92_06975 [Halomonas gudaonensis]